MSYQSKLNAGIKLQNKGLFSEAADIYKTLLKKKPKSFDARQLLALCYYELEEPELSIAEFKVAIKNNASYAATRNNFGNAYMEIGDYDKAKTQFKKAISINPKYSTDYNNLGNCLLRSKSYVLFNYHFLRCFRFSVREHSIRAFRSGTDSLVGNLRTLCELIMDHALLWNHDHA